MTFINAEVAFLTDVVYGAAFFSDMMDFNTFDLHIGPVRINVARFFKVSRRLVDSGAFV